MPATSRLALPYPLGTDPADVPTDMGELAAALDNAAIINSGSASARSSVGLPPNAFYFATDTGVLSHWSGTTWTTIGPIPVADGSLTEPKYGTDSVSQRALAPDSVGKPEIKPDSVGESELVDGEIALVHLASSLKPSGGAAGGVEALRAIGAGSGQVVAGNDPRLADQRTPADNSVTAAKIPNDEIPLSKESPHGQLYVSGVAQKLEVKLGTLEPTLAFEDNTTSALISGVTFPNFCLMAGVRSIEWYDAATRLSTDATWASGVWLVVVEDNTSGAAVRYRWHNDGGTIFPRVRWWAVGW